MSEKFSGDITPPKNQERMKSSESHKDVEEHKFNELVWGSENRSLHGTKHPIQDPKWGYNLTAAYEDYQKSLGAIYWDSGNPGKMAMFKLRQIESELGGVVSALDKLGKHMEKMEKGEKWEMWLERNQNELRHYEEKIFNLLGIPFPETVEEAETVKNTIINFENFKKLERMYWSENEMKKKSESE